MDEPRINIDLPGEPDGTLTLALRTRSESKATYQARRIVPMELRRNPRNPYVTKSLGTTDLDKAKAFAIKWERSLFSKISRGQALHPIPFSNAARKHLKRLESESKVTDQTGQPLVAASKVARARTSINRYLVPFFGDMDIRSIDQLVCDQYLHWRMKYYVAGPGLEQEMVTYQRDGHRLQRPVAKNAKPAPSTVNKDVVCFNEIMTEARLLHSLPKGNFKIKVPKDRSSRTRRRPRFYDDELRLMDERLIEDCIMATGRTWFQRHMLFYLIQFILGTGIRVSEAYWIRMRDLELRPISDRNFAGWNDTPEMSPTEEGFDFRHTELPMVEDRPMEFRIRIGADNPGLKDPDHARVVIPTLKYSEDLIHQLGFVQHRLHELGMVDDGDPLELPKDQHIFIKYDGSRAASYASGFKSLLERCKSPSFPDGLRMSEGKSRPLTSLRHTYASKQIEAGATRNGLGFLADNMGTSPEMLRKHYAQVLQELNADDLQNY